MLKFALSFLPNNMRDIASILITFILTSVLPASVGAATLDFPDKDASTVGIAVVEISSGRIVASENYNKVMLPASTLKSVTSATALNILGPDYIFVTNVIAEGNINGNVLNGNIVVKPSGDPTIQSEHFPETAGFTDSIVNNLKRLGISVIRGDIIVDEDGFEDPAQNPQWAVGDLGCAYGTGNYAFNFRDNIFRIYPESQRTVPDAPWTEIVIESSEGSNDVVHGVNSDLYVLSGRGVDRSSYYTSVPMNSPSTFFIAELKEKLKSCGVSVYEEYIESSGNNRMVYSHRSPQLKYILRSLMVRSDNMMAESVLRALDFTDSRSSVLAAEKKHWQNKGIDTSKITLLDGSGLARANRVSPKFISDVLVNMANGDNAEIYTGLFPKVGKDGTVRNLLRRTALDGKLALKSGSLNGVHCYAGYKFGANGTPTHVVVVMVNNFYCSRDVLRSRIQSWLLSLF